MMIAEKLRKSILQAAIAGKLSEQRKEDGDARDLLAAIKKGKAQLVRAGKLKKEKALPPVDASEAPFEIPENWCWARLGDCALKIHYGFTASAKPNGNAKLLRITDIQNNQVTWANVPFCTITEKGLADYGLQNRDIVIARTGGTIGKSYIVRELDETAVFASYLIRVIPSANINEEYLKRFMESPLYWKQLTDKSQGTGQPNVNGKALSNLMLPLPPLAEQERIVQVLQTFTPELAKLETDEQQLDALESAFPARMKSSLLLAAMRGELTEREAGDGDAHDLLRSIEREKKRLVKEKKLKKEKPLPPVEEDDVPFEIPETWCWTRLGNVCIVNPRNKIGDESIDVSFLPMANIDAGFQSCIHPETRTWSRVKSNFTHFADGDVAFAKIKPCFENRKSAIMEHLANGLGAGTTELHVLRPLAHTIDPRYLLWFVKNPRFIYDGVATYTGTAGQQRVSTDFVKQYPFPLPPLAEQQRIVARLEEFLPLCEM